jgi:hypothetical protein
MKEVDDRATMLLLSELDEEINLKCFELKQKQEQVRLKRIFFLSCLLAVFIFMAQIIFRVFNLNFVTAILVYQVIVLALIIPLIPGLSKGVVIK